MTFQTVFKRNELKNTLTREQKEKMLEAMSPYLELVKVKITNVVNTFRLAYNVTLSDTTKEKQMIDHVRECNGNLEFMVSKQENRTAEL